MLGKYLFNIFLLFHVLSLRKYDRIIVHYAFHSIPLWLFKGKVIILSHGVEWYDDRKNIHTLISRFVASQALNKFTTVANDTHYYRTLNITAEPGKKYFSEIERGKWFIPNCVDSQNYSPSLPLNEYANRKIVLVPRQITVDRGIDIAIKAFNIFVSQYQDFEMLIIGPIRDVKYKQYCDSLIGTYHLESKVTWKHDVLNDTIMKYYNSATMTLIPTVRREGTSLSALESMVCGCPTVSTNVAGLQDLPSIKAFPNPESIAEKLAFTYLNKEQIGIQQRSIVLETFNTTNWKNAWLRVLA